MAVTIADLDNADTAEQMFEETRGKQLQQQVEAVEYRSTQQWLLEQLDERSTPVPIMGREFEFRPIGNETVEHVLELATSEVANIDGDVDDLEDVDGDDLESMPRFVRGMRETLEDHCTDEYMARKGLKMVPVDTLLEIFDELAASGN